MLRHESKFHSVARHFNATTELPHKHQDLIFNLSSCKRVTEISRVHGYMVKTGLDRDSYPLSKLLALTIHVHIQYAASIFKHIKTPNLFMFNTIIRGYSVSDHPRQAFGAFNHLRAEGLSADEFSFVGILKSCARESEIGAGIGVHGIVLRSGHVLFNNLKNSLLSFYCVCKRIGEARKLFDEIPQWNDSVSFNTLMNGYLHDSQPGMVIALFNKMQEKSLGISIATLLIELSATGDLVYSVRGESVHGLCVKLGFVSDLNVATALIDMYAKTGDIDSSYRIFETVGVRDLVVWNCMIDKFARKGMLEKSLGLLQQMKSEKIKPNSSTLVGLLSSCVTSEATSIGRCIGNYIEKEKLPLDAVLGTALVDMYAKLGDLAKAVQIFERIESRDVKSWTTMISSYGTHGLAGKAIELFNEMEKEGFKPNEVTFLAVLSASSHGGMVMDGVRYFEKMVKEYGFIPKVEHYGCIIDLLGRAGLLDDAYNLITSLPIKSDATAWRALLAACRVYGNASLGECVKSALAVFDENHPTDSILLVGAYAVAGRLQDQKRHQEVKTNKEDAKKLPAKKAAGYSTIEMDD